MIRFREYVIKYIDSIGNVKYAEESAANTSEALEHFFQSAPFDWRFVSIYEKR